MNIEEHLLTASIRNSLKDADAAVLQRFHLMEYNTTENIDHGQHADDLEASELTLAYLVEKVFRDTAILAERLALPKYCRKVLKAQKSFKDLAALEQTRWDVVFHSEPLAKARSLFESLETMTAGRELTGLAVFENFLENTSKIISQSKLVPSNEAAVRKQVRTALSLGFTDVVSEIPLPKNIKTYKPDIGIRSLMAAAEYKFIVSKPEAKKALDEVYADMRGYSGHPEWRSFYAVMYMTEQFYTQKQLEEEFRLVKADLSWRPIVVVGKGERASKIEKSTTRRDSSVRRQPKTKS